MIRTIQISTCNYNSQSNIQTKPPLILINKITISVYCNGEQGQNMQVAYKCEQKFIAWKGISQGE